jgi:hypothetical protein
VSVIELSDTASTAGPATAGPAGGGSTSTHGFGVVTALRLARALGQAPRRVVMVAVEGDEFGRGEGLGPAVAGAVPEAVGRVLALLSDPSAPPSVSPSRGATEPDRAGVGSAREAGSGCGPGLAPTATHEHTADDDEARAEDGQPLDVRAGQGQGAR